MNQVYEALSNLRHEVSGRFFNWKIFHPKDFSPGRFQTRSRLETLDWLLGHSGCWCSRLCRRWKLFAVLYLFLRYKCIISSSNNSRSSLVFFAYSTITTININSAGQGIKIRRKTRRASFLFDRSWFIWKKDIKFFARLEFLFTHYSVEICVLMVRWWIEIRVSLNYHITHELGGVPFWFYMISEILRFWNVIFIN